VLAPLLLGRSALEPVAIWDDLYSRTRDFGQKGTYVEALSAIDIALWDITGKHYGKPVHMLLGGASRTSITAYATGGYYKDDYTDRPAMLSALEEEAAGYVDSGFGIVKMKIGLLSVKDDAARVAAVRGVVGDSVELLVDANHAYNAASAIRMGHELADQDVLWFEEPVVPEDRRGYREVRSAISVPVAGGEAEFTRFGFRDLISEGCVDIIQPDLCCSGGFSEFTKIHALASSFGVLTVPHVWGSGIALAAAAQAIATIPPVPHTYAPVPLQNEPVIEFDRTPNPLRDELLIENFTIEGGQLAVPQGPGLGVTIDEDVLKSFISA
jgi:D-galactarolactone cycloisomerase